MQAIHDYEETGAEYEERQRVIRADNERTDFIKTREKRIAIFSNMVAKFKREIAQLQLSFR